MFSNQIDGECAKHDNHNADDDVTQKLAAPVMFGLGIVGGWLCCGIWFGHYF